MKNKDSKKQYVPSKARVYMYSRCAAPIYQGKHFQNNRQKFCAYHMESNIIDIYRYLLCQVVMIYQMNLMEKSVSYNNIFGKLINELTHNSL